MPKQRVVIGVNVNGTIVGQVVDLAKANALYLRLVRKYGKKNVVYSVVTPKGGKP